MKNRHLSLSLWLALSLYSLSSQALNSDTNNPATFIADHVFFNYDNGTTIYSGHVNMTQGTTHLTADKVTVFKDKYGHIDQVIAEGSPAHYATLPDQQKKPLDAAGDTIKYYPQQKLAVIIGNGLVMQGMNSLQGSHIIYNMANETVVSDAGAGDKKSVIVLQPNDLPQREVKE